MQVSLLRKARRMPVVRALDGSYRVGGDHDVYAVWWSYLHQCRVCDCQAARLGARCSHLIAVDLAIERDARNAAQRPIAAPSAMERKDAS
ncbi:MAG: hypothetical protein M3N13_09915 [Candidatus Eremiobacteraeota bacterium]|nr:hypothetical protein [Candidatus Eremiobacteraeota bacterium]